MYTQAPSSLFEPGIVVASRESPALQSPMFGADEEAAEGSEAGGSAIRAFLSLRMMITLKRSWSDKSLAFSFNRFCFRSAFRSCRANSFFSFRNWAAFCFRSFSSCTGFSVCASDIRAVRLAAAAVVEEAAASLGAGWAASASPLTSSLSSRIGIAVQIQRRG